MSLRHFAPGATALAALILAAACASGGGAANRGGDAQRGAGFAPMPVLPVNTPMIAVEHSAELSLTDEQRTQLRQLWRSLDSTDAPLRASLDSLRPTRRPVNPRDVSQEQRDEMRTRNAAISTVVGRIRDNTADVRTRALALLSSDQQQQLAVFEEAAQKRAEEEASRGSVGDGTDNGQQRRHGGGGGRRGHL
jgi:hypothetical protein